MDEPTVVMKAVTADNEDVSNQILRTPLERCMCASKLEHIFIGFSTISCVASIFVFVQGFPGGIAGYFALPGSLAAVVACIAACVGCWGVMKAREMIVYAHMVVMSLLVVFHVSTYCVAHFS